MQKNSFFSRYAAVALTALVLMPGMASASTFIDFDDAPLPGTFAQRDLTNRYSGLHFQTVKNSTAFTSFATLSLLPISGDNSKVSRQTAPDTNGNPSTNLMAVAGKNTETNGIGNFYILMTFDNEIVSLNLTGMDYYSPAQNGGFENDGTEDEDIRLTAFSSDVNAAPVFDGTFSTNPHANPFQPTVRAAGFSGLHSTPVKYVLFSFTDTRGGFGIDSVRYTELANQVPEPASMLLMGAGLLGLALYRRNPRG